MNISEKIENISNKFSKIDKDIDEINPQLKEVMNNQGSYNSHDVVTIENLMIDLTNNRKILNETVSYIRKLMEKASLDCLLSDGDLENYEKVSMMSNSLANITKVHSQLYKDFSTVLVNIKNLKENDPQKDKEIDIKPISTIDLIQQLKDSD